MYPGPEDQDFGVFVQQLEAALADRGHEIERAAVDRRGGGKRRYVTLARDAASGRGSVPPGCRVRALPGSRGSRCGNLVACPARRHGSRPGRGERGIERRDTPRDAVALPAGGGRRGGIRRSRGRAFERAVPEARGKTEVVDYVVDVAGSPSLRLRTARRRTSSSAR